MINEHKEIFTVIFFVLVVLIFVFSSIHKYIITKRRLGIDTLNFSSVTKTSCEFSVCFFNDDIIHGTYNYYFNDKQDECELLLIQIKYNGYIDSSNLKIMETRLKHFIINKYRNDVVE